MGAIELKPEPYHPPLEKALTETQRQIMITSTAPAGGPHPVGLRGPGQFAAARALAGMGLGQMDGRTFTASARGMASLSHLA